MDNIREDMIEHVLTKTNTTRVDFNIFLELIKKQRDKFVAHYDGDHAGYAQPTPQITVRKMIGAHLEDPDWKRMLTYANAMAEFVLKTLCLPKK